MERTHTRAGETQKEGVAGRSCDEVTTAIIPILLVPIGVRGSRAAGSEV